MRCFLMTIISISMSFGSLYGMDGLYIQRTLRIALRWKADDARRKHFVRAAVTHLNARSVFYQDELRDLGDNKKRKEFFKSEIQQDMELLEGLAKCDFNSYLPEGARAHDRLEKLQKELT